MEQSEVIEVVEEVAESIDYTQYIDEVENMISQLNSTVLDLTENTEGIKEVVEMLKGNSEDILGMAEIMQTFQEYIAGACIFGIVCLLAYFSYKFLKMFF